jgi:hypothetical protein
MTVTKHEWPEFDIMSEKPDGQPFSQEGSSKAFVENDNGQDRLYLMNKGRPASVLLTPEYADLIESVIKQYRNSLT